MKKIYQPANCIKSSMELHRDAEQALKLAKEIEQKKLLTTKSK